MLDFMDRVQNAFYSAIHWNRDNSYARLNESARALLDFPTPRGIHLSLSSLSSPQSATSFSLSSLGPISGSLSYLYSSIPLPVPSTANACLQSDVIEGYRQLQELVPPRNKEEAEREREVWLGGERIDQKEALLYGRMYLPRGVLEGLWMRRVDETSVGVVKGVSGAGRGDGGTLLAMLQQDVGKWSMEYMYSSDVALLGWRGLYNFGRDPRTHPDPPELPPDKPVGRFSAGAELYYGVLNKSAGMSTGLRYTTLPKHPGIPLTMTVTLNPLMGHISATYAVRAGESAAFASRFEFNIYSYESDVVVGCELWSRKSPESSKRKDLSFLGSARLSQKGQLGLLWEGRIKELLFSVGGTVDFRETGRMGGGRLVKKVGLEVQYSS
ncbi:hypothetical protein EX30DRAFT_357091 [Ascodesmis nigricans]|uniref:Mitochondrial distribution and morphology protein 10 n=1 Tax=Ascodesmis nigricans TaxID=341454 RepID=A0A4S2N7L0_9PEZI|nr:hypothetical protein EX30DRAFT_357091 [Ascodesmis nigricans]